MDRIRSVVSRLLLDAAARDRLPIIFLAIVAFAFFLPSLVTPGVLIWPHSGLGSDIAPRHWADLAGYAAHWRSGRLPLWDPFSVMGRPLAGDTAVLFLYPFDALFLFLPPALAFNANDAIHVFLAGLFTFFLLRVGYIASRPAALFGGLAFAFMPKLMAHLAGGHVGVVWGLAWSPAVLLGLTLAFRNGSFLAAALAALALAIPMSTHVQQPYYTAAIGSGLWLYFVISSIWRALRGDKTSWEHVGRLIAVFAFWLIAFALIAAFEILPLLEILPYSNRASFTLADANWYALPPPLVFTLFAPSEFQFPEWTMFLGILPLVLGAIGWRHSRQPIRHLMAALAVFALIYALGTATPFFGLAFELIPGFKLLRVPTRLWFFGGLAIIVLAGFGVDVLAEPGRREWMWERRRWLARAVGVYAAASVTFLLAYRLLFQQWHELLAIQLVTVALIALLGAAWLIGRIGGRVTQWLLIPSLLLDLLPTDASYIDLADPTTVFLHSTPALDFVSAQPGDFRVYSPAADLPYAVAAQRKVEWLEGLLSFQLDHAIRAIRLATGCAETHYATAAPPCLNDRIPVAVPDAEKLGRLNVRYVSTKFPLNAPGFKLVMGGSPAVYENMLWQPRVRLTSNGRAEIVNKEAGLYEVAVNVATTAQLVVVESWAPGWQATVDGQPRNVERVEDALIGVSVEPGEHMVRFVYDPLPWEIGWRVSAVALTGLVVWVVVTLWRRKTR